MQWKTAVNPIGMLAEILCFRQRVYLVEVEGPQGPDRFYVTGWKEPKSFARYYWGSDPSLLSPCRESDLNARLEAGKIRFLVYASRETVA